MTVAPKVVIVVLSWNDGRNSKGIMSRPPAIATAGGARTSAREYPRRPLSAAPIFRFGLLENLGSPLQGAQTAEPC